VTVDVGVECDVYLMDDKMVIDHIQLSSQTFGVETVLGWVRNSILGDIKETVEPYNIIINL
jgi:hypothetical protein